MAILIAAGFSTINAQAYQDKNAQWTGWLWVGCANNGEGEWFYGTLYEHGVFGGQKYKDGWFAHWNYDKSSVFTGEISGEVLSVIGATNVKFNKLSEGSMEWNEMLVFKGDKGTEILVKTKWHWNPEDNDYEMELFFENCL